MKKNVKERRIEHMTVEMYPVFCEATHEELGMFVEEEPIHQTFEIVSETVDRVMSEQAKHPNAEVRHLTALIDVKSLEEDLDIILEESSVEDFTFEGLCTSLRTMRLAMDGMSEDSRMKAELAINETIIVSIVRCIIDFRLSIQQKEEFRETPIRLIHTVIYDAAVYDTVQKLLCSDMGTIMGVTIQHAMLDELRYDEDLEYNISRVLVSARDAVCSSVEESKLPGMVRAPKELGDLLSVGLRTVDLSKLDEVKDVDDVHWN